MAPRPKLKYSNLGTAARGYRGDIGNLRRALDVVADMIIDRKVKAGFTTVVGQTLREFTTQLGISILTAAQALVSNSQVVTVKNSVGTTLDTAASALVSSGALQSVNLSATVAGVGNGQAGLTVKNSAGTSVDTNATASVAAGVISGIALQATNAVIANGNAAVPLGDATAVAGGQDTGTAAVAAGVVTRITLPGTDKIVKSTVKYLHPAPTGTWTNGATYTIVNGVITAVVLS